MNKDIKRKLKEGKLLYPLNVSLRNVFSHIKESFLLDTAIWLAKRELKLRKKIAEKKAKHYKKDVNEPKFEFSSDWDLTFDAPFLNMERKDVVEIIREQAGYHFDSFKQIDRNFTFGDIMSEVAIIFMKCYRRYTEDGPASFKTYLNTAIVNHIKDLWRKRKRRAEIMSQFQELVHILDENGYPAKVDGKWVQG